MNIILLSGGSGKRLWPLSNDVRSKQFIKLFKDGDKYESMVQRVYRQITTVDADAKITIATSKSQASAIKNQLGEKASICVEPCRRDTFPAIALAGRHISTMNWVLERVKRSWSARLIRMWITPITRLLKLCRSWLNRATQI